MNKSYYVNDNGFKSGPFSYEEMNRKTLNSSSTIMDTDSNEWKPARMYDFNKKQEESINTDKGSIIGAILAVLWYVFVYCLLYWGMYYLYQQFMIKESSTVSDILIARLLIMGIASYCSTPYTEAGGNIYIFWIPMVLSMALAIFSNSYEYILLAGTISIIEVVFWSAKVGYRL